MKKLLEKLKQFDMLGPSYKLEVNGLQEYKSLWGFIFSVLMFGFCGTAAVILGKDVWERKKPLVSLSMISKTTSEIPLGNFPVMVSIYDKHGINKPNFNEYLSFRIVQVVGPYTDGNPDILYVENEYHFFHCDLAKEYDYYSQYSSYNYLNLGLYCPNFDQNTTFFNDHSSENSITYTFYFSKCDKSEMKCADDLDEVFDTLDIFFTTVDSLVDATNYLHPIKEYEYNKAISLSNAFQKTVLINLERAELASDEGWIFEDVILTQFTKVSDVEIQYSILAAESKEPKVIMKLSSIKSVDRTTRNYLKIQEVFARIGGIANALLISLSIILKPLIMFEYYSHLRSLIDSMLEEDSKVDSALRSGISRIPFFQSEDIKLKLKIIPSLVQGTFNQTVVSNQARTFTCGAPKNLLRNDTLKAKDISTFLDSSQIEKMSYFKYLYLYITCDKQRINSYDDYLHLSKKVISLGTYIKSMFKVINADVQ